MPLESLSKRTDLPGFSKALECKMTGEPLRCNLRHFFQRSWFLEQMRGSGDDNQFLLAASKRSQSLLIQVDDWPIMAANNQQCWCNHGPESISRQIGPAAARDHGRNLVGELSGSHKCCGSSSSRTEIA